MMCPMFETCRCLSAACRAQLPDVSCYWYRWFKQRIEEVEGKKMGQEFVINIEKEVRAIVQRVAMEEIENLGVRAAVKERLLEAGLTDEALTKMVSETVDSHFRSAMNVVGGDVYAKIEAKMNKIITDMVGDKMQKALGDPFSCYRVNFDKIIKDSVTKEVERRLREDYDVSLSVAKKNHCEGTD